MKAYYIAGLLDSLHLDTTADTLRRQAGLDFKPNLDKDIRMIIEASKQDLTKQKQLISCYFTRCLKELIREGRFEEAISLFENELPLYLEDLEPFSLLFADTQEQNSRLLNQMLAKLLKQTTVFPYRRVSSLELKEPIRFIEVLNRDVLVIDSCSNAKIIKEGVVSAHRTALHLQRITCIAVNQNDRFCTGSVDKTCRLWNSQLQLLYQLCRHNSPLSAICFSQSQMTSSDEDGALIATSGAVIASGTTNPRAALKNSLPYFKLKTICYMDMKYIARKDCILGAGNVDSKGRLDIIDLQHRRYKTKLSLSDTIYSMEISSQCQLIFLSLSNNTICAYSISNFEHYFRIQNDIQNLQRTHLAAGGNNHDLLAFGGQDGTISFSSIRRRQLVGRLRGVSGKGISCLRWMAGELWTGCEAGWVQQWGDVQSLWMKSCQDQKKQFKGKRDKLLNDNERTSSSNSHSSRKRKC